MRVLYIDHYAGSPALGMEYRPYYLAREWVKRGHEVRIVAASFSHVRARQPSPGRTVTEEAVDGIVYRWLSTPRYEGNGAGRAANIATFLWRLWRDARVLADTRPDVVIASSTYPMDIWVARHIARLCRPQRAKLVFEIHDLWPLSPVELAGMSPRHPFIWLCQRAEDAAYRDADLVVSILPKVHGHVTGRGLDPSRLVIVPNGIATDEWSAPAQPLRADVQAAIDAARARGDAIVGYAGSMGLPNALDVLLDAAALLGAAPITIVLLGDGHERVRLEQRIRREGLNRVTLRAPIPKAQLPSFLSSIDLAYVGWQRQPIYRFGIAPNKLMDYMMAGCAVLHSVEAGNDPVAESGCGLSVAPESAPAVADGLCRMAAMPASQRRAMGARGRDFVLARHSYSVLAQRFLDAIER